MTTETLPPCPLPDCEGGEHHYHETRAHGEWLAGDVCEDSGDGATRCYSQHRPGLLAQAWDEGADFVARHPDMSAEYVRAANPYRQENDHE